MNDVVDLIRSKLYSKAQLVNDPVIPSPNSQPDWRELYLPLASSKQRVLEIPEKSLLGVYPGFSPGDLRGVYDARVGRLMLNEKLWCVETFVHETLHAVSVFGRRMELFQRLRLMFEGLTEFYTGYLLKHGYSFCYDACWSKDTKSACYCTYQQQTKMWSVFCRFIPLPETFGIYFWNGSEDWESHWSKFVNKIRELGYPKFEDVLDGTSKLATWIRFHQQCVKHFGREYEKAYSSLDQALDMTRVKLQIHTRNRGSQDTFTVQQSSSISTTLSETPP